MKTKLLLFLLIISLNGIGQNKTYSDTCTVISRNALADAGTYATGGAAIYVTSSIDKSEGLPHNTFRGISFTLAAKSIDKLIKHRKFRYWSKCAKTGKDRKGRPFKLHLDNGRLKRVKEQKEALKL